MDQIRRIVQFSQDPTSPIVQQFVHILEQYTQVRYELSMLKSYQCYRYAKGPSVTATISLSVSDLIRRNGEILPDSAEYQRNVERIDQIQSEKEAEILAKSEEFSQCVEAVIASDFIKKLKYEAEVLDMMRRRLLVE